MQKLSLGKAVLLCLATSFAGAELSAQCNVNDKYDKIISGYHSSIALKDDGTYAVWGSGMTAAGNTDLLAPTSLNLTTYPAMTGTVLKVALGGNTSNTRVDQALVLTTNGLWAWGTAGVVVSTGVKSGTAFGRTSTTSANGFNTYGLPSTLVPSDVASLFATYQTLLLLTTTGNVWVLAQTNQTVEANGGTGTASNQWRQVKVNSSTNLTGVTAVRGQVSSGTYNAFMAITTTGQVYTWGNSSYLGDASASAARNYATLMTLPVEFTSSNIPKMIGVSGGIATTATTKNTYYLLSNTGSLYTMGDNSQRQCGDFTTTERTGWVNAKINSTTNFTNVNTFSVQEHNSSFPGAVAVTTTGDLYTWGNNSSSMIGRTDDGTSTGTISASYNPGMPIIFNTATDNAVSAEMGGHTLVYLKEGTSQFCYVGHRTNGSMGDGTSTSSTNGGYYASCSSTPTLNICGSVPDAASVTLSAISATPASITANGSSTAVVTIQLKNSSGTNLTTSGGVITTSATAGTLGTVTDNNNGTYTVVLTSNTTVTTSTVSFAINGTPASLTAQVAFTAVLPLTWQHVAANRDGKTFRISWTTDQEQNVSHFDVERSANGINWQVAIAAVPAINQPTTNHYLQTDNQYTSARVFYRVKQFDLDGRFTYSPVKAVASETESGQIVIYPAPVVTGFQLSNVVPERIKQITLVTTNGTLLKSWKSHHTYYNVHGIASGFYVLRIETVDGKVQNLKLHKQ